MIKYFFAAAVVLMCFSHGFAGWNSMSAGYGLWRATEDLDGFARSDFTAYRASEFHGITASGTYDFSETISLTAELPYTLSVKRTDTTSALRHGFTDLQWTGTVRFPFGLLSRFGAGIPLGYQAAGDPWLASGSVTVDTWHQISRSFGTEYEVLAAVDLEAIATSSRTKAGGLRWNYSLTSVRSLGEHRLKAGWEDAFKYVRYGSPENGYGDPYYQRTISLFLDSWLSLNEQTGLSIALSATVWGFQSSAGNKISAKITRKFSGRDSPDE